MVATGMLLARHDQRFYGKHSLPLFPDKLKRFFMVGMIGDKKGIEPISFMPFPHAFFRNESVMTKFGMGMGREQNGMPRFVYDRIIGQGNEQDQDKNGKADSQ